ncbi:MAG: hypothetical protein J07HQW2_00094 [Haloquadratum walsbyi J07HQW2]|uniref:Uncharacterized protein n=1 Tax=Haloquadratum walsbyi J07HQW2 TaxID=1238425 RepID=U1PN37_9EURY|nr:MAG: hypothetical protein J07HQW2_00094 [Haloquadratum walsbyi J07HQW2]
MGWSLHVLYGPDQRIGSLYLRRAALARCIQQAGLPITEVDDDRKYGNSC